MYYNFYNRINNTILAFDWFSARRFVTKLERDHLSVLTGVQFKLFQIGHLRHSWWNILLNFGSNDNTYPVSFFEVSSPIQTYHVAIMVKQLHHHAWRISFDVLWIFTDLHVYKKQSLIPGWTGSLGNSARHLTLVCKRNPGVGIWKEVMKRKEKKEERILIIATCAMDET